MRLSHFFIDRPIFASVVSIVIVILGAVAYVRLPVAQYPEIAPPVIQVTGQYPGASADVAWLNLLQDTVLVQLVRRTLEQSRDIQIPKARQREARFLPVPAKGTISTNVAPFGPSNGPSTIRR